MSGPARIHVHIDRLTLVGVAPGDAAAVRGALSRAIAAELASADPAALGGDRGRLSLSVPPVAGAADLGQSAGRALARQITGARR
ncbi:hypothetical protein [Sphingomonas sp. KR3-1]|uniref:hypothetical protein n=1 Tax=Sphingomonas sp. KR3-1 TaxID=3156611 RepID=UPI0032B31984